MLLPPALQLTALLAAASPNFMECGSARLCGVLTLESGLGPGRYEHEEPVVHGLWPQVGKYGNSACVPPRDRAAPAALASCFRRSAIVASFNAKACILCVASSEGDGGGGGGRSCN